MKSKGIARRIASSAAFSAVAILVAMLVQLLLALVLEARLSVWGLLSVNLTETADASSISLGTNLGATLLLWLGLTAVGAIPWRSRPGADGGHPASAPRGARPQTR